MSEAYLGELRLFGFDFAPRNWALCNGQLLPISQNTALFSLLNTNFGGNGTRTFGLPNLAGNVCVGAGKGASGTLYAVGQTGGQTDVTLTVDQTPLHTHAFMGLNARTNADSNVPGGGESYANAINCTPYLPSTATPAMVTMAPNALSPTTGNQLPHSNQMPTISLNFCICTAGVFPPRD